MKKWIFIAILLLVIVRALLPLAGEYAVNWYLGNKIAPYKGHISDFDLSLWRGAYEFENFVIEKKEETKNDTPLLSIKHVDVSLAWRALFKGRILADLIIDQAQINLIDSNQKENIQTGLEGNVNWQDVFITLVPIDIESLKIQKSQIHFRNYDLAKPINVYLAAVDLSATNINNTERVQTPAYSEINLTAKLQDKTSIHLRGRFDILSKIPAFDLSLIMEDFDLTQINDLLKIYGPLTFTRGTLSLYSEMATRETRVDGYIKPFFKGIDVVANQEVFANFKHFFNEVITALGNLILRSNEKTVAFRVAIDGPVNELSISTKDAFLSALKNAFTGDKIQEGLEGSISLKDVKKGQKPEASPEQKEKIENPVSDEQ